MTQLVVTPSLKPLTGIVTAPVDLDDAAVTMGLAMLAHGESEILGGVSDAMISAARHLGLAVQCEATRAPMPNVRVTGRGDAGLQPPKAPIAFSSALELAVLAALLVNSPFACELRPAETLSVDEALEGHAYRIARALRRRGAIVEGKLYADAPHRLGFPLRIEPASSPLGDLVYELGTDPIASGYDAESFQCVKTAALISGIDADGFTRVHEHPTGRQLVEKVMVECGLPLEGSGPFLQLQCLNRPLPAFRRRIQGDRSMAAALWLAALAVPNSVIGTRNLELGTGEAGLIQSLRDAGHRLGITTDEHGDGHDRRTLTVAADPHARAIQLIDDRAWRSRLSAPLRVVAAATGGRADIPSGALASVQRLATYFNLRLTAENQGPLAPRLTVHVEASATATGAPDPFDAQDDPQLTIAATLLALRPSSSSRTGQPVTIDNVGPLHAAYPRWVGTLVALGANVTVVTA